VAGSTLRWSASTTATPSPPARSSAVATQLRARGLRVELRGLGPETPVADDATDEGRARNRRVEVWLR